MGSLSGTISQMAILIMIACMGFVSAKVGYIDADMRTKLTKILVNVTLPCMISISANDLDASAVQDQIPLAFVLAGAQFALLLLCGILCNVIFRTPKSQRPLYLFMTICTNSAFIGLPMISSLYGGQTVLFASIFVMVLAFFMYSIGLGILAGRQKKRKGETGHESIFYVALYAIRELPWKSIANPSMLSCLLAIALLLLGVKVPSVLADAMDMLGSVTSPIAMMLVGSIVAEADIKSLLKEPRIYLFTFTRQFIVPLGLLVLLSSLGVDESLIVVFTIMFAMPIGSLASPFAEQFGHDALLAAKGTVISTAASFVIVPILAAVITMV